MLLKSNGPINLNRFWQARQFTSVPRRVLPQITWFCHCWWLTRLLLSIWSCWPRERSVQAIFWPNQLFSTLLQLLTWWFFWEFKSSLLRFQKAIFPRYPSFSLHWHRPFSKNQLAIFPLKSFLRQFLCSFSAARCLRNICWCVFGQFQGLWFEPEFQAIPRQKESKTLGSFSSLFQDILKDSFGFSQAIGCYFQTRSCTFQSQCCPRCSFPL